MYCPRTYLAAAACIFVSVVRCQAGSDMNCALTSSEMMRTAHVFSHRNETGHLITEVDIEHIFEGESKGSAKTAEAWEVVVEHRAKACRGKNRANAVKFVFTVKPARVGSDYRLFPGVGYYKLHVNATTWSRAREICADEGAHLAIINSVEEADALTELYRAYPAVIGGASSQDWAWIGLYKNGIDGDYFTIFDDPIESTGFTKWNPDTSPKTSGLWKALFQRTSGYMGLDVDAAVCAFFCEQDL